MARVKRRFLRDEIQRQGRTQVEVAEEAGLHRNTITNIVTGKIRMPDLDTLTKIARVLGVAVTDLITEE